MDKKSYSEKLKDPRWQKIRLKVFNRDKFTCKFCTDNKSTLSIHHKQYISGQEPWEYALSDLVCTCQDCHAAISAISDYGNKEQPIATYKYHLTTRDGDVVVIVYPTFTAICEIDVNDNFVNGVGFDKAHTKEIIKLLRKQNGRMDKTT